MSDEHTPVTVRSSEAQRRTGPGQPDRAGPPVPGRAPVRRGLDWIVRGWGYFYRDPLAWTGAMVMLFLVNRLLFALPVIGLVAARVLSPIFSGGLMTGCRNVDAGGRFRLNHLFAGFSDPMAGRLAGVGGLELAMMALVGVVFGALWVGMGLPLDPAADPQALAQAPSRLIMPLLIMFLVALPVIMLILFAPVLIILHGVQVTTAMGLSYRACVRNIGPMLVWVASGIAIGMLAGLLFAALASMVGQTLSGAVMVLLFGGVLGSVYMGSVYAAYVDIFVRAGQAQASG